jgi:hypothetical protein
VGLGLSAALKLSNNSLCQTQTLAEKDIHIVEHPFGLRAHNFTALKHSMWFDSQGFLMRTLKYFGFKLRAIRILSKSRHLFDLSKVFVIFNLLKRENRIIK